MSRNSPLWGPPVSLREILYMSKEKTVQNGAAEEEKQRYLGGLKRLSEKGVRIYIDGQISEPADWEKLFEIREDRMFYMGDYVQAEAGGIEEVRFDKVYLSDEDVHKKKK